MASNQIRRIIHSIVFFCGRYELDPGHPLHYSPTCMILYATDHGLEKEYQNIFIRVAATENGGVKVSGPRNGTGTGSSTTQRIKSGRVTMEISEDAFKVFLELTTTFGRYLDRDLLHRDFMGLPARSKAGDSNLYSVCSVVCVE